MGRKLLTLLFISILLVGTISALDFDNVRNYDTQNKEVTITNAFGLGSEIARVKLNTDLNQKVGVGYVKVFEFTINSYGEYKDAIKDMEFYNIKKGMENTEINLDLKYKTIIKENVTIQDCSYNKIEDTSDCKEKIIEVERIVWENYLSKDMLDGEITIAGFTNTKDGDKIEFIPTWFGERLTEYASWEAGLNTDLLAYYNMDQSSGNAIDSLGTYNLTNNNVVTYIGGKLGNTSNLDGTNYLSHSHINAFDFGTNDYTYSFWLNTTSNNDGFVLSQVGETGTGERGLGFRIRADGDIWIQPNVDLVALDVPGLGYATNDYILWTVKREGTNLTLWKNGEVVGNATDTDSYSTAGIFSLGSDYIGGSKATGRLDEVAIWGRALTDTEIITLYNGGTGTTYTTIFDEIIAELNSPVDYFNTTDNTLDLSCNFTSNGDTNISNVSILVYDSSTNLDYTNIDLTPAGLTKSYNKTWTTSTLDDGEYNWSCNTYGNDLLYDTTANRTFTIDTILPVISLNSPTGTVNYHIIGNNLSLNWSVSDTNLDSCWFNYNNTNTTVTCADNNYSFITVAGKRNITFYANDTFGNLGSNSTSWSYSLLENSQTYNELTYGSSFENFLINLTYDSVTYSSITASLMYNNTAYIGTKSGSGDTVTFSKSIQIPTSASEVNKTFYWRIGLIGVDGTTYYNSTFNNQTISPIILHICDDTYTTPTLNFSIKEEGTFLPLNASLEATFDYWGGGDGSIFQEYNFANLTDDNDTYTFCIAPAYATFTTDATISYLKDGYDRREYYLNNYTISNDTEDISLYLSTSASTDIFTITVIDENQAPVSNAYVDVLRWDIGTNAFYSVGEIITTQDGTGTINLRLYDTWYKYQVTYNNILYLTTEPVKEASTSRTLEISFSDENPYNNFDNIQYSLTYDNSTNVTLFEYNDPTGAVQIGCLNILEMTAYGNTLVHTECVESTGTTLSYTINDTGTYVIRAIFRLGAEYNNVEKIVDEIIVNGVAERFVVIGKFGQVISLIFTGTMAMIGIASGSIPLGLFLIIASLFAELKMGWINISSSVLYGFISIAILIALGLRKK